MSSRRSFLQVVSAACVGVACDDPTGKREATGPWAAGSARDLSGLRRVAGAPLVVARDDGGIYAMSAICTHQQCDMTEDGQVTPTGIHCDCHASDFDARGVPVSGPARAPLRHYRVSVAADGALTVHAGEDVPADHRVAG